MLGLSLIMQKLRLNNAGCSVTFLFRYSNAEVEKIQRPIYQKAFSHRV